MIKVYGYIEQKVKMSKAALSIVLISLFIACSSHAMNPNEEFSNFFTKYHKLANDTDPIGLDMIADDAKIIIVNINPDGIEHTMKMSGKKIKELAFENLDSIKKMGNVDTFNNIKIVRQSAEVAKITADRFNNLKCNTDHNYYIVVSRKSDKKLYLTETYSEMPTQSLCKAGIKDDLALQLTISTNMMKKNLPVQVSPDVSFDSIEANGKEVTLGYRFIHFEQQDFDEQKFKINVLPGMIEQGCKGFKELLDKGATIHSNLFDKHSLPVTRFSLNSKDCA